MPKFLVELPDGRKFQVEADHQPTEQEILAQVGEAPPKATAPLSSPAPVASGDTGLPESHSTLETVFGLLNTVPRQIEQGATTAIKAVKGTASLGQAVRDQVSALSPYSKVSGETPLTELGMEDGLLKSGLGLGLDMLAPIGPVGAAIGAVGKGAKFGIQEAAKLQAVQKAAAKMKPAAEAVQSAFVQYPGMSKLVGKTGATAEDYLRLHESELNALKGENRNKLAKIFEGISDVDRVKIADYMNEPGVAPLSDPRHIAAADEAKKLLDEQFKIETNAGQQQAKNQIQDYYPWVIPQDANKKVLEVASVNSDNPFAKKRQIKTWQDAKTAGALQDPVEALDKRLVKGQRAVKQQDFVHVMAQEFGAPGGTPGTRPLNWNRLKVSDATKQGLQGVNFPEALANQLEKGDVIWADPNKALQLAKAVTRNFKDVVTTWNPAHHANNLQGNIYMMMLGGMKPQQAAGAYKPSAVHELHTLFGDVKGPAQQAQAMIAAQRDKVLKNGITEGDAFDAARKYNIFGSSENIIEYNKALGKTKGKYGQTLESARLAASRYVEDPAKWALFKDQVLKGKSPEQAAIHVKNHLFDYSELTDFEKGLRDYGVAPFYSWIRKNIPLQAQAIAKTPQTFRRLQVAYDAPNKLFGKDIMATPLWMKEEGYVPVSPGSNEDGSKPMSRVANPALDLNKVLSPAAMATGLAGPLVRAGIEGITGNDLRTGRKILGNETGYTTASPLGALMETARIKGLPLGTSFGTEATPDGFVQGEKAAFLMNQLPMPLIPYAQRIAGSPKETIGAQLNTPVGKKITDIFLRTLGLTPRDLTPDQQLQVMMQALDSIATTPVKQQVIQETGKAFRK